MKTLSLPLLLLFIVIFRLFNALVLIQSQFDPDEYWQTSEPAYCEAFFYHSQQQQQKQQSCPGYTWEWSKRPLEVTSTMSSSSSSSSSPLSTSFSSTIWQELLHGPVRSYISVLPTFLFYKCTQFLHIDSSWIVSRGPLIVNAIFVAVPTDLAVFFMAQQITIKMRAMKNQSSKLLPLYCLACSLISWFNAYALVRTYSNSLETMLLAVSLSLISPELLHKNITVQNPQLHFRQRSALCFLIGGLCTAIRFSSLVAYIPLGLILAYQYDTIRKKIYFLFFPCAIFGILGIIISICIDKYFYGFWVIPFISNFHFNVLQGNGSLYGTHPFHWYWTAGIPAITGLLLPCILWSVVLLLITKKKHVRNLWIIIFCYIMAHSFSAHKEFRFILPMLPLFCVLAGEQLTIMLLSNPSWIFTTKQKGMVLLALIVPNLVVVLFLGLFHQRGPIDVNWFILQHVGNNTKIQQQQTISVHYLMGCHSTPLLSHLHAPPYQFNTWALDCSPDCRVTKDCESDQFSNHPRLFVEQTYLGGCKADNNDGSDNNQNGTCLAGDDSLNNKMKIFPNYIVITSSDYIKAKSVIEEYMGFHILSKFTQNINGLKIYNHQFGEGYDNNFYTKISLLDLIELSIEEIIVLAGKSTLE